MKVNFAKSICNVYEFLAKDHFGFFLDFEIVMFKRLFMFPIEFVNFLV